MSDRLGIMLRTDAGPGILHQLTGVIAKHQGAISTVEILHQIDDGTAVYFEIDVPDDTGAMLGELTRLSRWRGSGSGCSECDR